MVVVVVVVVITLFWILMLMMPWLQASDENTLKPNTGLHPKPQTLSGLNDHRPESQALLHTLDPKL